MISIMITAVGAAGFLVGLLVPHPMRNCTAIRRMPLPTARQMRAWRKERLVLERLVLDVRNRRRVS